MLLLGVAIALALPLLWGALHALRLARRTRAAGRFPPPGFPVVRDTPVRRGPAARRFAAWLFAVAAVLAALAVLAGAWLVALAAEFR